MSQEYVDGNGVDLHQAGFRTQQILHSTVKIPIGCVSGKRDGNEGLWTHWTDAFAKNRPCGQRVQDMDDSLHRLHDLPIFASEFAEFARLYLKKGGNGFHRVALVELLGQGMIR